MCLSQGCELTRKNVSYDECLAGAGPCAETCNGLDDDEDGAVDEGLAELCANLSDLIISRSGIEGGFGRSVTSAPDLDGDGYHEVLVSATRSAEQIGDSGPLEGEVSLISGGSGQIIWTVRSGGDFGFSITSGAFRDGDDEWSWCAGAPTREERAGTGRVICLNFDGEVESRYSSEGAFGLGRWLTKQPRPNGGSTLVVTEPYWGERTDSAATSDLRGRIMSLSAGGESLLEIERSWSGAPERSIGERAISTPDVSGDGVRDWLLTGYTDDQRQVWLVDGASESEVRSLKRFSTGDQAGLSFGESLAVGQWGEAVDQVMLAIGAPQVLRGPDEPAVGRVYFTTGEGDPIGTNTALNATPDERGLGQSLASVRVGEREVLVAAGDGIIRVISIEPSDPGAGDVGPTVIQELPLPKGASPTLGVGHGAEPDGVMYVWIGLPELEEVRLLTIRPPSAP